jgi:hypothetical protein
MSDLPPLKHIFIVFQKKIAYKNFKPLRKLSIVVIESTFNQKLRLPWKPGKK